MDWLSSALSGLGDGLVSILSWLFSGVLSVLAKMLRAATGIFDLLDSLGNFFISIKDVILGLLTMFFPWIPAEVVIVISLGFFAILLAGIVKKVSGR